MKKIIIISSALFITVLSSIVFINYKNITFNHKDTGTAVIEKEEKSISEEAKKEDSKKEDLQSTNEKEEKVSEKQNKEEKEETTKKEDNSNKVEDNASNQNNKKISSETSAKAETSAAKKSESSIGIVDPDGNNKTIDTVKIVDLEPWVKAGVSKEDYYNKPVYSWARIDYPVSECKSLKECESLCLKDAEPLAYSEDVSCIEIYTYSGTYLGEMLKKH